MSATLYFDEIFRIFSDFLKGNFKFITCKLILAERRGGRKVVEKVYKLGFESHDAREMTQQVVKGDAVDEEILSGISKSRRVIFWEDFVAIPLITQNEVIGALNVEGLEEAALERFLIVARQFGLEIEKVRLYETVQELAITDGLTGMFVRRYFFEMLKVEFDRSLRHNFKLSFIMADLDYFKQCNDRFGHLVGDAVLREVARVLKQNLREVDLLCRYGGEEFSALLPETDKAAAFLVAERLRSAVEKRDLKVYDEVLRTTISIGVCTYPDDAKTITELIELADKALYGAKAGGRNRSQSA
ncbi:MAG: sensor domain-containing diguanylate cyclase [Candidatus Omnitrophica bacterium]|nr:sensor domain-containing diguanylate cyclase [Candidatus Omnitrophota bacterium]